MTDRHALIVLRQMWETSRDGWQSQLDRYEKSPYAGTRRGTSRENYRQSIANAQARIDSINAELAEAR